MLRTEPYKKSFHTFQLKMLSPRHARANSAFFALLVAYLGALLILSPHSTAQASAKYVSDSDEGALGSLLKTAQEVARQFPTQLIKFLVDVNAKLVHTTDNLLQILRDLLPFGKASDNSNSDTPNKESFENVPKIENDAEMDNALAKSQKIFVMARNNLGGEIVKISVLELAKNI